MRYNPYIVGTGTTSAFLGDERLMREFIVGDHHMRQIQREGHNSLLYLINDSYDALNEGQLRLAVNKNPELFEKFLPFCGQPIAEVPDPYNCHESLAAHFIDRLQKRLRCLDIHPVVMDAYKAYKQGHYQSYVSTTFERYHEIQDHLSQTFDSTMKNLFRVQCKHCRCIDSTHIVNVENDLVQVQCERCGDSRVEEISAIQGKLSWKLDCAARWNIYGIHAEAFSKAHITDLGSYDISKYISEEYFGGQVPEPLRYGEVKVSPEISYRLLEILPPPIFKQLFTENMERDLDLNKDSIEHFCRRYEIRPGTSYVDFVKNELPILAIKESEAKHDPLESTLSNNKLDTKVLVDYGNRFSGYFYRKEYEISLSGAHAIFTAKVEVAKSARDLIEFAIKVREPKDMPEETKQERVLAYMQDKQNVPGVFPYMRKIFAQEKGPGIAMLLTSLPVDYLHVISMAIGYFLGHKEPYRKEDDVLIID